MKRTAVRRLAQAVFVLASCAPAAAAHASYGQMRLDGIGLLLGFVLLVGYGALVDILLLAGLFRYRVALVVGVIVALLVILLFAGFAASPTERTGLFKGSPGGAALVMSLAIGAVFLPFIVTAPFGQYRAMARGRRLPGWITAWIVLQVALVPGFLALGWTEEKFWQREFAEGMAVGKDTRAGGFGAIAERAGQRRERIWGTGFASPWQPKVSGGYSPRQTAWISGLAKGLGDSAPIAANEPLGEADRAVLDALIQGHFSGYAPPKLRTKLLWDELQPGGFRKHLAPMGVNEVGAANEEVLPLLLQRLETDGTARLCPGGRMMDADRAVLTELVVNKTRFFEEAKKREDRAEVEAKKEEREMSQAPFPYALLWKASNATGKRIAQDVKVPDWSGYPQRVERVCGGSGG